jgi:hypothetical protein
VKIGNDAEVLFVVVMTLLKQMPLPAAKKMHCHYVRRVRLLRICDFRLSTRKFASFAYITAKKAS